MKNGWASVWLLVLLLPLVGCKGCTDTPDANAKLDPKEEEARKKKQQLVVVDFKALPFSTESAGNTIKPGHWYQVRNKLKANYGDESLTASITVIDREEIPMPIGRNESAIEFKRNVSLAVGQEKSIDLTLLHPDIPIEKNTDDGSGKPNSSFRTRFTLRGLGTLIGGGNFPNKFLDGYQYNLVVLSRDISRHTFWRGLDCIVWRTANDLQESRFAPHRIVDINQDELAGQFPNRLATMTSISHIVVNDLSLSGLSNEQQSALADWLHFGGTIIVNGPEAVAGIESSQLKDWVPLQDTSEGEWIEPDQEAFSQNWSIRIAGGDTIPFRADRKIPILKGTLAPGAAWVPSLEGLVADRLIGQGRVVMTTFPMTDAAFLRWPSYSSMIHNGILRKPPRTPTVGNDASTMYADEYAGSERNPYHNTRLRMWSRDLDLSLMRSDKEVEDTSPIDGSSRFPEGKSTSIGAWNPSSRVLEHATACLRESSGITVPQVGTIVRLLIGYLVILVPVNWLVFRLINRVELAWLAAPAIALLGALIVARSVQLDIGFSRSQATYGFLECHNAYPRGLLASYNALYTSLSTNYRAVFNEGDGLVVPISRTAARKGISDRDTIDYWMADERGSGLQNLPVLSNSTGIVQTEAMVALGASMAWTVDRENGTLSVTNDTRMVIRDIGMLGLDDQGKLVSAWVGSTDPGQSIAKPIALATEDNRWFDEWDNVPLLRKPNAIRASDGLIWSDEPVEDIYLGPLLMVIAQRYPLQRGEMIALGWIDSSPSQLEISPTTLQQKQKTLVLMHVQAGALRDVRPDTRIFASPEIEEP